MSTCAFFGLSGRRGARPGRTDAGALLPVPICIAIELILQIPAFVGRLFTTVFGRPRAGLRSAGQLFTHRLGEG